MNNDTLIHDAVEQTIDEATQYAPELLWDDVLVLSENIESEKNGEVIWLRYTRYISVAASVLLIAIIGSFIFSNLRTDEPSKVKTATSLTLTTTATTDQTSLTTSTTMTTTTLQPTTTTPQSTITSTTTPILPPPVPTEFTATPNSTPSVNTCWIDYRWKRVGPLMDYVYIFYVDGVQTISDRGNPIDPVNYGSILSSINKTEQNHTIQIATYQDSTKLTSDRSAPVSIFC